MSANVLIVSQDTDFVETMSSLLQRWGMVVELAGEPADLSMIGVDIVLLDIRQQGDCGLTLLPVIRMRMPEAEIILVNKPDNIQPSIAGMLAGADDEIISPFDTVTLQNKIFAAVQCRRKRKGKRSLLKRFEDTMTVITFALAGEYDTAIDVLNELEEKNSFTKDRRKK
jgi:two-component system, OmpR family, response regulator